MKENVGRIDRVGRFIVGPALAALGYARLGGDRGSWLGLTAIVIATAIVDSAITRVCPVNALLGIDTRSTRERARDLRAVLEAYGVVAAMVPPSRPASAPQG